MLGARFFVERFRLDVGDTSTAPTAQLGCLGVLLHITPYRKWDFGVTGFHSAFLNSKPLDIYVLPLFALSNPGNMRG